MSKTYTVSAKTVAEAIEKAKSLYGGGDSEITTEIIETPKKGFLGIGSKDAVIKITVEENDSDELASLVDDIKKYKGQTEKNTGYYVPETNKGREDKKRKGSSQKQSVEKTGKGKKDDQESNKHSQQDSRDTSAKKEQKNPEAEVKSEDHVSNKAADKTVKQGTVSKEKADTAEAVSAADSEETDNVKLSGDLRSGISEEEMNFSIDFINSIIRDMDLYAIAERAAVPDGTEYSKTEGYDVYPVINITGDDTGILIGHHGETLDSLQYLVNLALFRKFSENNSREGLKVIVDIENYRQKREDTLKILARKMASKAVKYKKNIFLEPMNPYERRIIHSELQNYPGVSTHSVGSDLNRKIVVTYEGNEKNQSGKKKQNRDTDSYSAASEE